MMEILVVLAIMALLMGMVAPAMLRQLGSARISVARQSLEQLAAILDIYRLDNGDYPSTDQGLQALVSRPGNGEAWNGPYLQGHAVPVDPWKRPFIYHNPSVRPDHDYDLCSRGPDQASGDVGDEGVICNP